MGVWEWHSQGGISRGQAPVSSAELPVGAAEVLFVAL